LSGTIAAKAAGTAAAEASSPQVSTARTAASRHNRAPACRAAPWPPAAAGGPITVASSAVIEIVSLAGWYLCRPGAA
jgi:hypothetical protein